VSIHFIYLVDISVLSVSFHVLVVRRYWLRPSSDISWTVTHFDLLVRWPSSYLRIDNIFYVEYLSTIVGDIPIGTLLDIEDR